MDLGNSLDLQPLGSGSSAPEKTKDRDYWRTHPHPADCGEPECYLCGLCPGDPIHVNSRGHEGEPHGAH